MNFNKTLKYITDRPFLMALIIFVIFFIAYNFFFKNKSAAATTVASTALPTYGRPTIYNQEFQQYPISPVPPQPVTPPPGPTPTPTPSPYPQTKSIRNASGKGAYVYGVPNNQSVVIAYQPFGSTIQVTGPAVSGPVGASFWPVANGFIQTTDVV